MDSQTNARQSYSVLMVAPTSFFSDYGCSVRILEEIRALQGLGHRVVVCTYRNGKDVSGMTIRRTLGIPFRGHYEVGSSLHKVAFDLLLFWTVLFAALRDRPDVIHAHMHEGALIGNLVGRLLRIPMVFDFQGSLTGEMMDHGFLHRESLFYGPLRWLERTIDSASPTILTSSKNARRMLMTDFGCPPEKVVAVSDCVDCKKFYPRQESEDAELADRRAMLGIPPGRKLVVYLGLLADYQGTGLLLEAVARILELRDDLHFLIMGFPSVDRYQRMALDLGVADHVTLPGKIPYQEARSYLALGDVAVAPKLSATEGSGKILNYMAMGLPTVSFETPVGREYLGDDGIYAEKGDSESLAEQILFALSDPKAEQRSHALRRRAVESFSWDGAVEKILRAYDSVCRG